MSDRKPRTVEYKCSWCGRIALRGINSGRPSPGVCDRKGKTADGRTKPHTWLINAKF